jgi:hypothetical protein
MTLAQKKTSRQGEKTLLLMFLMIHLSCGVKLLSTPYPWESLLKLANSLADCTLYKDCRLQTIQKNADYPFKYSLSLDKFCVCKMTQIRRWTVPLNFPHHWKVLKSAKYCKFTGRLALKITITTKKSLCLQSNKDSQVDCPCRRLQVYWQTVPLNLSQPV